MSPLTTRNFTHILFRIPWLEGHFPWSFRLMWLGEHVKKGETFLKNIQKTNQKRKNTRTTPTPPVIPNFSSPGKPSSIPTVFERTVFTPQPEANSGVSSTSAASLWAVQLAHGWPGKGAGKSLVSGFEPSQLEKMRVRRQIASWNCRDSVKNQN